LGSLAEEEAMKQTYNVQRPTLNTEPSAYPALGVGRSALDVGGLLWRILDFMVAAIFIFAGLTKILDLDHLIADLQQLQLASALADVRNLSLANPAEFASDIDNFKILPWSVSVALAFYLPWLEIFCALGLVFRFCYRGALSILSASIVLFTLAIIAAKVRGLDITCGCFGHASQHWSFPSHLATNLAILGALTALGFSNRLRKSV
jgi:Methylamine utilisation protein MauE